MSFNVRHLVEQIIVDYCAGQLQKEEISWPFDDSLLVHLVVDPSEGDPKAPWDDIEIRQECPGHVFIRTFNPRLEWSSGLDVPHDSETYNLYKEEGLSMFVEKLRTYCGNTVKLFVDGSTGRKQ